MAPFETKWVNIHLLVDPEESGHVDELKRFLEKLTFEAYNDRFVCTPADLVKLGKQSDTSIIDNAKALAHGSEQFKVSLSQLKDLRQTAWAKQNVLIAVAGSMTDGTSGVREAADKSLRIEVEKFADIIFASSSSQRDFWLGKKSLDESEIRRLYGNLKPCLHGSDAHTLAKVGIPDDNRYSWIKGAICFDALRQATIDPAGRAFVGESPPISATPSQVIASVTISNADWITTPTIPLNPGLVAIIGARGSGKTALAEMIAVGCDSKVDYSNERSFLYRAREHLGNATISLDWAQGGIQKRTIGNESDSADSYSRARYLSQQFVDELCASEGVTDALLTEIERVVFEAHDATSRDGAVTFEELLESRAKRFRMAREGEEHALTTLSDQIAMELQKNSMLPTIRKQIEEKHKVIDDYVADRSRLVSKGSETRAARLVDLATAAETVRGYLRFYKTQEQDLLSLRDDVAAFTNYDAPGLLRSLQASHQNSGLDSNEWNAFSVQYKGDVQQLLSEHIAKNSKGSLSWKGAPQIIPDKATSLISADTDISKLPLSLLEAEIMLLQRQVNLDRDTSAKFTAVSKRIADESAAAEALKAKLEDYSKAKERGSVLAQEREIGYKRVLENIIAEQKILQDLYQPLMERLSDAPGTVGKLSFTVKRFANTEAWAREGERLLDLRRTSAFKGQGSLQQLADEILKPEWETGSANDIAEAMTRFREETKADILDVLPRSQLPDYRAWAKQWAQWLYGTKHIAVRYSVDYDGLDIRKLSPGTRGIVLLLLYLSIDDTDDRPLIIDQPEENLDPKSIYDELVGLFMAAKAKRQIIVVTHNANIVVNADADQVIVATAGPHIPGRLPPISYMSGGLESASIRQRVCDILEGGEQAFRERARRLRVGI